MKTWWWLLLLQLVVLSLTARRHASFGFDCAPNLLKTSTCRKKQSWRHQRQERYADTNGGGQGYLPRHETHRKEDNHDNLKEEGTLGRRSFFLRGVLLGTSVQPLGQRSIAVAKAATAPPEHETESGGRLTDSIAQSLVFERTLGSGSYKTVYLVSVRSSETTNETNTLRYAMAVERLRTKRDVKNAFRGVKIPELIQEELSAGEQELFETIIDWWVQSSNVPEFAPGERVFPGSTSRSRSEPKKNFAGSRWMISLKPVYETDFKRFIQNSPTLFPVGKVVGKDKSAYWTEPVLLAFVLEILHAGKLLHQAGIVHRDIKPKNMMIYNVASSSRNSIKRPVIIDYGFAELGSPLVLEEGGRTGTRSLEKETDICVVRPGQLKGEVDYVLVEDLGNYRGCQRGDAYALGKTLYEFVFGSVKLQEKFKDDDEVISLEGAEIRNQQFRNLLYEDPNAGTESRFLLSRNAAECLLSIIRGLCGNSKDARNALSFADAEEILSAFLVRVGQEE